MSTPSGYRSCVLWSALVVALPEGDPESRIYISFPGASAVLERATTWIEEVQATRATRQPFGLFAEHTCTRARPESLQGNSCEYDTLPGLEPRIYALRVGRQHVDMPQTVAIPRGIDCRGKLLSVAQCHAVSASSSASRFGPKWVTTYALLLRSLARRAPVVRALFNWHGWYASPQVKGLAPGPRTSWGRPVPRNRSQQ